MNELYLEYICYLVEHSVQSVHTYYIDLALLNACSAWFYNDYSKLLCGHWALNCIDK